MDIVRRKLLLVTIGTERVKTDAQKGRPSARRKILSKVSSCERLILFAGFKRSFVLYSGKANFLLAKSNFLSSLAQ